MISIIDKLSNVYVLIAINLAIIFSAEFVGGGRLLSNSQLIHLLTIVFLALIVAKIFAGYSFADSVLKGFLKMQLYPLVFLGLVHLIEYVGHLLAMGGETFLSHEMVDVYVVAGYLVWFLANLLGCAYLRKVTYKGTGKPIIVLTAAIFLIFTLVAISVAFGVRMPESGNFETGAMFLILFLTVAVGVFSVFQINKNKEIMPVFRRFVGYSVVANILVIVSACFEFLEISEMGEKLYGIIPEIQIEYFTHFALYAALSVLILGFDKLLHLPGVYTDLPKVAQ